MIIELNPELKPREMSANSLKYHQESFYRRIKQMAPTILKSNFEQLAPLKHLNYLEYLSFCYANHFSAVVSPEHLWYVILCNLAAEVKDNPEKYRPLFTDSADKKEISVQTDDVTEIDVSAVIAKLRELVFFDMSKTLPRFSTSTELSELASGIAFCDMASPFYNYSTYLCGFPQLKILGMKEDWLLFKDSLASTGEIFKPFDDGQLVVHHLSTLWQICDKILEAFDGHVDLDFFNDMFKVTPCGSGHQEEIDGWITLFFKEVPSLKYVENFLSCVSQMQYKNIDTQRHFKLSIGLFSSKLEDGFLVPEYGKFIEELSEGALMTPHKDEIIMELGDGMVIRQRKGKLVKEQR
jgi:Domain of unknown function (DUF4419)